ncbi:unnamed protein product, partial [Ilex paraguariensis]
NEGACVGWNTIKAANLVCGTQSKLLTLEIDQISWVVKEYNCDIPHGQKLSIFEASTDYFTIKMHHSGKFEGYGDKVYTCGRWNHFDMCHADQISLIELNNMLKDVGVGYFENTKYYHRASKGWRVLKNDQQVMELEKWANSNRVVDLYVEHNKTCILNPSQAESTCSNGVASKSSSHKDEVDSEECSQGESSGSEYFYNNKYDMENSQLYENAVDDDSNFVGKGKRVKSNKQKGDQNVKAIGMDNDSGLVGEDYESDELQSLSGSSDKDETGVRGLSIHISMLRLIWLTHSLR